MERVIAEGIEPPANFSTSLLPGETLVRRSETVVEFRQPGLNGAAILLPEQGMTLVQVLIKLPRSQMPLSHTIVGWVEKQKGDVRLPDQADSRN